MSRRCDREGVLHWRLQDRPRRLLDIAGTLDVLAAVWEWRPNGRGKRRKAAHATVMTHLRERPPLP